MRKNYLTRKAVNTYTDPMSLSRLYLVAMKMQLLLEYCSSIARFVVHANVLRSLKMQLRCCLPERCYDSVRHLLGLTLPQAEQSVQIS